MDGDRISRESFLRKEVCVCVCVFQADNIQGPFLNLSIAEQRDLNGDGRGAIANCAPIAATSSSFNPFLLFSSLEGNSSDVPFLEEPTNLKRNVYPFRYFEQRHVFTSTSSSSSSSVDNDTTINGPSHRDFSSFFFSFSFHSDRTNESIKRYAV